MDDGFPDEQFVRPFMFQGGPEPAVPVVPPAGGATAAEVQEGEAVRPYLLTGGRVHDSDDAVEKTYQTVRAATTPLSREHEQVLGLCVDAQSVAEISAHLKMPLGVAAVLARDLQDAGLLVSSAEDVDVASDVSIILRLRNAIRSL